MQSTSGPVAGRCCTSWLAGSAMEQAAHHVAEQTSRAATSAAMGATATTGGTATGGLVRRGLVGRNPAGHDLG
ncbi:hypothetical protein, partial [Streptomyces sp. Agncl-13]|uniref:hypothetical protein n=1 Tax=Streptomyces sp. Agncl-13 TaxID=3400628 RepID=UPI003A8B26A4